MGSTRQDHQFVQIYQDPMTLPSNISPNHKPRPQLQPSAMPLQPMRNPPTQHPEVILSAPMVSSHHQVSPLKSHPLSPPKPNYSNLNYIPIPPPHSTAHMYTDSPAKRHIMPSGQQFQPVQMMQQPMFTTFNSNFDTFEQENFPRPPMQDNFVEFPEPSYMRKMPLKRSYSDAPLASERPLKKARQDEEPTTIIPPPEEMPAIEDDGNKPSYSYAQMIGMAILRAPNRRLTLAQIYEWISTSFTYYREDTKQSWHNSIRHNLSLHKAFKKEERPKGDPGKGSYWVIEPGMEGQFIKDKDKHRRGNNLAHLNIHASIMRSDPHKLGQPLSEALMPSPFMIQSSEALPPRPQTAPALPELSSDATLPASDPALEEQDVADTEEHVLPAAPKSSPPVAINSSPPVRASNHHRNISSPTARMKRPASAHRQKRSLSKMDDSGYFSSIESSVLRPNKNAVVLTSELDIEPMRKKTGRAEEEIDRIRSSSHDLTPSHARFRNASIDIARSSSPVRVGPATRLNPVTPSVVFKKPIRPPHSISPNTQLHLHRKAMRDFANSPIKSFGQYEMDTYSPLKWSNFTPIGPAEDSFEIFSDAAIGMTPATPAFASSPLKASVSRSTWGRATTTGNALSEMVGNAYKLNAKTPTRGSLLRPGVRATLSGSPLKGSMESATGLGEHDLFDFNSFENEVSDNEDGVDILKGFEKIGGPSVQMSADHIRRPSLGGRSFTSRF
ncbi:Forkhead transcription factor [Exophiala xenobiotica]|nr:Forkhead transcription factor [Exophiala xenobiotica]